MIIDSFSQSVFPYIVEYIKFIELEQNMQGEKKRLERNQPTNKTQNHFYDDGRCTLNDDCYYYNTGFTILAHTLLNDRFSGNSG